MTRRLVLLTLLIMLLASACGRRNQANPVTVVLFDLTASTAAGSIRGQYLRDFGKILEGLTAGGTLAVDIIDDNPLAHSSFPIMASFSRYDPLTENRLGYDRRIKAQREAVARQAQMIVTARPSRRQGTSVMDALQLAERAFASYEGSPRVLVLFSDMIEQSGRYDFAREALTPARIKQIVERERAAKHVPDLRDVEVCVVGAGAARSGGISPDRFLAIQAFWIEYFKAAGAHLPKERYGSALLKCP